MALSSRQIGTSPTNSLTAHIESISARARGIANDAEHLADRIQQDLYGDATPRPAREPKPEAIATNVQDHLARTDLELARMEEVLKALVAIAERIAPGDNQPPPR